MNQSAEPLLQLRGVSKHFGGVSALQDVSLSVQRGSIHGLIGPNGAGKTTLFNVMTGFEHAQAGTFIFAGRAYRPGRAYEVARMGLARTFQNIRLFAEMTALENVLTGFHTHCRAALWQILARTPSFVRSEQQWRRHALDLLGQTGIADLAQQRAETLSYGAQRRLEIARALALSPQLLALDEPAAGMNAAERAQLQILLRSIRAQGCTLLLIEHDVALMMGLCDCISVLDGGRKIAEGAPEAVRNDPEVIRAYLGSGPQEGAHAP